MSLEEIRARLLATNGTTEELLALVTDLYFKEIHSEEKFLAEALSELHNSGEIDLVDIVRNVDGSSCVKDFFTILHPFENALPSLNAKVEDVLHCLVHLTQLPSRNLAVGGVYRPFELFCRMDSHRPRNSVGFILKQNELSAYAPFLSSSILAYSSDHLAEAIHFTENLIVNANETVRNQAYFSLGRLAVDETQANFIWGLLSDSANREHANDCCASILRAILHFGETFPSYWLQIEELLNTFVEGASTEVLHAISDIVSFQRVDLPERVLHLLIKQLANTSSEHRGIIDNIDHLLVKLIERDSPSLAVELLESILVGGVSFKSLDYFSNKLLNEYLELRNLIITKWFLSGKASLCHGILDLLHDVTGKDIEFKAEMSLLDNEVKQIFVCRKAVGWLFTLPKAAASFILSVSETASALTLHKLEEILYDPLLLSYPGELKRFFQLCIDNGLQEQLCERLLGKLHAYHTDIETVAELKELMASTENVNAYWKDFDKDMQEANEVASQSSFISMIATTQRLLYGNSSIYYLHQLDGTSLRQEMQMQSFSHSTEMPRLNVLDPESLDYNLRIYRCERMKNEVNS